MRKDCEKLSAHLGPNEPPAGLLDKIMARIRQEQSRIIARRLILASVALFASLGAFIPAINFLQKEFAQSGFWEFLSLIFSDLRTVIANWQDFGFALLESLPAMGLVAFLAALLVALWSLKRFAQILKAALSRKQLIHG